MTNIEAKVKWRTMPREQKIELLSKYDFNFLFIEYKYEFLPDDLKNVLNSLDK